MADFIIKELHITDQKITREIKYAVVYSREIFSYRRNIRYLEEEKERNYVVYLKSLLEQNDENVNVTNMIESLKMFTNGD
jgi:hypothetical protein